MVERRWDLAAVAGYALLAAAAVWALHPGGAGGIVLAPLLIVCPGYALLCAIEDRPPPDALELVVTTVALSFATAVLGGLVLDALHIGLTARTWSALFLLVTAAATAVAAYRRVGADDRAGADHPRPRRSIHIRARPLLATATICALLSAAAVIAVRSQQAQDHKTSTTALAVLASNDGSMVHISVVNAESRSGRYRVRIKVGRRTTTSFPLVLASGEHWSGTRDISRSSLGPVRVELFSATRSAVPLRTVTATVAGRRGKASHG